MERAVYQLLMSTRDYALLTQEQVNAIVAALEAFDYGSDTTGAQWRDRYVAALKSGDRAAAQFLAGALVGGRGFGEPTPCTS